MAHGEAWRRWEGPPLQSALVDQQAQEPQDVQDVGQPAEPAYGLDATASFEGNKAKLDDNATLVRIFQTILADADRYRAPFTAEQLKCYNQYNGSIDDSGKAEWQSRLHIPLAKQAVDISTSRAMNALVQSEDFFDIQPYVSADDQKVQTAKNIIKWQLWKSNYRQAWTTSIKDAFICGFGPLKVRVDRRQGVKGVRTNIVFDPCIPTDVWLDPTGRSRFKIHRVKRDISDLWAMTEPQQGMDGNVMPPVYDKDEVAKVKPGATDTEREVQSALIRRDTPHLASDQGVDVYEYWGDFYDPATGVVLYKNVVITFVNKQYCIRRPQDNPYKDGADPFIIFSPTLAPHQIYGYGLLTAGSFLADEIDKTFCVIVDKVRLTVPGVVAYPNQLRDPAQLGQDHTSFKLGKVWLGKDPDKPPFAPALAFEKPSMEDFQLLDRLMNAYRDSTGVNEFATGTPQSDNRKTKEEVQERTQATAQVFNDAASHIEDTALSPLLKKIYYRCVQFENEYDDNNLVRMFGDGPEAQAIQQLKQLPEDVRWDLMYLDAEFRCNGISNSITKQQRIGDMMNFYKIVAADQSLGMFLDKTWFLKGLIQGFNQNPNMILPVAKALIQAQQQGMIQQLTNPQPQPGQGGPPGQQPGAMANNPANEQSRRTAQANQASQQPQQGGPPQ